MYKRQAQWLPSGKTEMAIIGPIVRNELFFFVFIFGAAALLVFREWQSASHATAVTRAAGEAEKRLLEAQNRRQRRWMVAAASACLIVILVLTADFIYARANMAAPSVTQLTQQNGQVRVPIRDVQDLSLIHIFRELSPAGRTRTPGASSRAQ